MNREIFLERHWRPYPAAESAWVAVDEFNRAPSETGVVCGRILSWNDEDQCRLGAGGGELEFELSQGTRWTQPAKDSPSPHAVLDIGDVVAIEIERRSQTWFAVSVSLLAPGLGPRPTRPAISVERSSEWMLFLAGVRGFFARRGFTEVLTPTLVPSPGTEPFLDPFSTECEYAGKSLSLYLPTSPEFHLKKMLVAGWTKIFEIKTCFRNGEAGAHHQPEFQMLEWYRAYSDLDAIADDTESLIAEVAKALRSELALPRLERVTMAELFAREFKGFVLRPDTSRDELAALAAREGIRFENSDTWDEIFFRLFLERIEEKLGVSGPVLVRGYPPSQAALARIAPDGFADRFEIYWRGLEIANAFHELNDPDENVARFRDDALKKRALGKPPVPVDEELIASLRHGLPPSGGIALGLERLFMAILGIDAIAETRAFPFRGN